MLKKLLFAALLLVSCAAQAAVYSMPWGPKPQFVDANGAPMSSGTLQTFAAGSSTPLATFTDSTGGVANPTTITLNTRGETPNEVWMTGGLTYKFVLRDSSAVTIWTVDNVAGINDITISNSPSEWIAGPTATYVSATTFTLAGDQTPTFTVGRRIRSVNSGGTFYGRITASAFGALTTVTVVLDSGTLDSGLSAISYGMLQANNSSIPFTKSSTTGLTSPFGYVNRGAIDGLTMSTAGGSATMAVATGEATDSTNVATIALSSSISKTTAAFAVGSGNGCLDTGAIANTTWYHFYVAIRADTGVVDVLCSLSATAPTMPANYTYKRRIGAGKTSGAAQWVAFTQDGDLFQWTAPVNDVAVGNPGAVAVTRTLASVPTGVNVSANVISAIQNTGAAGAVYGYLSDLATADSPPGATFADVGQVASAANDVANAFAKLYVRTNTSAQIRSRLSFSDANVSLNITTLGWVDQRGRNQ